MFSAYSTESLDCHDAFAAGSVGSLRRASCGKARAAKHRLTESPTHGLK